MSRKRILPPPRLISSPNVENRSLFIRDNLPVLRCINDGTIDLIYLDPPFNTGRQWADPLDAKKSFDDTWEWSDEHDDNLFELEQLCPEAKNLIEALGILNGGGWKAYLTYMGVRLVEMHRILKNTGSIYFHCDPTMSHGVKLLMDSIFGKKNLRNEIIWCYTGPSSPGMRQFARKHDVLLYYSKGDEWCFNVDSVRIPYKESTLKNEGRKTGWTTGNPDSVARFNPLGKFPEDWWQMPVVAPASKERTRWPTQKPLALLDRIIKASSNKGDIVLDPFCGCATTCVAAESLDRQWIGIDIAKEAKGIIRDRLKKLNPSGKDEEQQLMEVPVNTPKKLPVRDMPPLSMDKNRIKANLFNNQGKKCNACDKPQELGFMELDHIIPQARGGQDEERNFQVLCRICNGKKGQKPMAALHRKLKEEAQEKLGDKMDKKFDKRRRKKV